MHSSDAAGIARRNRASLIFAGGYGGGPDKFCCVTEGHIMQLAIDYAVNGHRARLISPALFPR